ncbi:hypothetical protein THIOM_000205 [Candidatus Thiomargarita nelsonii]|uniref:Uncharacterized protein n=1 Tax=Candidatus Thiomargarita nelsonii TaxID=1003181 RepID=A0A176S7S5_9GAMM|nr:hypothetical protein THIOM_000205 [Candidatus Thiomargarita nelsonii]
MATKSITDSISSRMPTTKTRPIISSLIHSKCQINRHSIPISRCTLTSLIQSLSIIIPTCRLSICNDFVSCF